MNADERGNFSMVMLRKKNSSSYAADKQSAIHLNLPR